MLARYGCHNPRVRTPVVRVLRLTGSLAVPLLMGAFVAATIVGPLRPVRLVTSYPLLSPALAVLDVAAGATLIGAGAMAWLFRQRLVGLLAMVAGACWFGPDWAGGLEVDPLLRATSLAASTLVLPLLVGMVLGSQRALRRWPIGALVALLVVITAVLAGAWMRWYAGRLDARCLELCAMDPISADADFRLARSMLIALMALQVVAAFALAAWSVVRLWRASAIGRRIGGPILAPAIAVGLAWAAWAIGSIQPSTVTPPTEQLMIGVFVARAFSLMALAIGLAAAVLRAWRSVQGVRGIAWRISPLPGGGSLRAALASALGDPALALRFPLPGSGALVDSDGRSAAAVLPGQAVRIEHGAELVALAVTSVPGGEAVAGDLGDAVRLAAANERLLAAVRHDVEELRAVPNAHRADRRRRNATAWSATFTTALSSGCSPCSRSWCRLGMQRVRPGTPVRRRGWTRRWRRSTPRSRRSGGSLAASTQACSPRRAWSPRWSSWPSRLRSRWSLMRLPTWPCGRPPPPSRGGWSRTRSHRPRRPAPTRSGWVSR